MASAEVVRAPDGSPEVRLVLTREGSEALTSIARMSSGRRLGIVIDGAGIGSAMTANKGPGVRAANAHDSSMARNAREHNYANVLTLGAGMIGAALAKEVVDMFLATPWGAERHGKRVAMITQIEQQYRTPKAEDPR